ncbi:chromosome condensation regulator RCC1 [Methylosinus sp. Sm6]|uniref:RCC1 domain-containing protein n=1 Tax=Methylosinus sp. Sm6 TaxID=2866948 RepID=UPI001C9A0FD5|nr:chromosome condensation regulator RCC1 [Methylosinus sp. Sm6]MBY6240265.1 chromosome condensation regulator RCC1 [Methylosinus sp. Sm6]
MEPVRFCVVATLSLALATPSLAESPTRTRLLAWPNPSTSGQRVALQAEVDGLGAGAPAGVVNFTDGARALGSARLSPFPAGRGVIALGVDHSCALTSAGGVQCWGSNDVGQLGDGTSTSRPTPVAVSGLSSGVVAVSAGGGQTCALTAGGAVKCWGLNDSGQVGDGTTTNRLTPVGVSGLSSGVVAISAGGNHSCALTAGGALKCWGYNFYGELGDGTDTNRLTPVPVSGLTTGVVAVAAGGFHTCARTATNSVKCWGYNDFGALGDGTTTSRLAPVSVSSLSNGVVEVAAAIDHTCARTDAGAVKCWGSNANGRLGDGTTMDRLVPVAVSGLPSTVVAITAGPFGHSCALTANGAVRCWGSNANGEIGDGTTTDRPTPVLVSGLSKGVAAIAAGGFHSCATAISGAARCWGWNGGGQLGDGTTTDRSVPATVSSFAALVRARARLYTRSLGVGSHTLRASYPGDAFHSSSSGSRVQTVQ